MTELRWGQGHQKRHALGSESIARDIIIDAAMACYAQHGLSIRLAAIAQQANITRPTIYRYFEGHEQLRLVAVDRIWQGLRPEQGSAAEWLESLRRAREYRLGRLTLSEDLFLDMQTVLLVNVESPLEEACARLFLSYLQIDPLTGSPLPLFRALLAEPPVPADAEPPTKASE